MLTRTNFYTAAATATAIPSTGGACLYSVILAAGADAATVTLTEVGTATATIAVVKAPANDIRQVRFEGRVLDGALVLAFTGTSPTATVEW